VSTTDQSVEAQASAMCRERTFDKEFQDAGVSGSVPASARPGFRALLEYIREGDTLHVYAVDRLGRDAIDVQTTIRSLLTSGVTVEIRGLGTISKGVGELIIAVLAQVADMERQRITERTMNGRKLARESLAATGRTHRGKKSLGRPEENNPQEVREWREATGASIRATALRFAVSDSTVKRYCAGRGVAKS
jgi:putative DNA-invertase from lambdoid prophage Rac